MTPRDDVPALELLVIRSADLERSRAFYTTLGLTFREETHGEGPLHYSCNAAGALIELYPARGAATGGLRLGLRVPGAARALERLHASGLLSAVPTPTRRDPGPDVYVVRDPDGNTLEVR